MIPFGRIGGRVGAYAQAAAVDPGWLAAALHRHRRRHRRDAAAQRAHRAPGARHDRRAAGRDAARHRRQRRGRRLRHPARRPRGAAACWPRPPTTTRTGSPRSGATEVLARDDRPRDDRPRRRRPRRRPARAATPPPTLRDGGIAVFTRPPQPPEPPRGLRFETVLVQSNAEQLRALAADLEAGRLRTRIAEVLPLDAGRPRPRAQRGRRPAREGRCWRPSRARPLGRRASRPRPSRPAWPSRSSGRSGRSPPTCRSRSRCPP